MPREDLPPGSSVRSFHNIVSLRKASNVGVQAAAVGCWRRSIQAVKDRFKCPNSTTKFSGLSAIVTDSLVFVRLRYFFVLSAEQTVCPIIRSFVSRFRSFCKRLPGFAWMRCSNGIHVLHVWTTLHHRTGHKWNENPYAHSQLITYVSEVIIVDRSALCSHSRCIFIGRANEKEIADSFANLILILVHVVRMRPICILMGRFSFGWIEENGRKKAECSECWLICNKSNPVKVIVASNASAIHNVQMWKRGEGGGRGIGWLCELNK